MTNRSEEFKSIIRNSIIQAKEIFSYEITDEMVHNITERIFINVLNEIEKNESNSK